MHGHGVKDVVVWSGTGRVGKERAEVPEAERVMLPGPLEIEMPLPAVRVPTTTLGEPAEPIQSCPLAFMAPPRGVPSKEQLSANMIVSSPVTDEKPISSPECS